MSEEEDEEDEEQQDEGHRDPDEDTQVPREAWGTRDTLVSQGCRLTGHLLCEHVCASISSPSHPFTDKEPEAWRGRSRAPKSPSLEGAELGLEPRTVGSLIFFRIRFFHAFTSRQNTS